MLPEQKRELVENQLSRVTVDRSEIDFELKCLPGAGKKQPYSYIHSYFLQFSLRGSRKDRDGWATASSLLGDRIRAARKKLGLTQGQLAERVGVTKGTLFTWEAKGHHPSGNMVRKLSEFFGVEIIAAHDQRRNA